MQPLKAAVQDNEHLLERYGLVNALYKFLFVKILVGHHSEKQALFLLISLYCQMISRISGAFHRLGSVYADKIRQLVFIYQAAAQHCDINNVVIDEQAKTVYLADPEMSLDVGSVGKGYAVEMVCQAAQARGLTSALVSVGGNLRAIGKKPDGSQWTGGVENPWNASEVYTTDSLFGAAINMSDMALVTSGDYQRYFVVDGKRYHHLIDPDTLWPAAYFNSVTVLCPDSGMADCLTTGLFCMPLEEGQKLVESLDGVEAMWCTPEQQAVASSGWESHTRK